MSCPRVPGHSRARGWCRSLSDVPGVTAPSSVPRLPPSVSLPRHHQMSKAAPTEKGHGPRSACGPPCRLGISPVLPRLLPLRPPRAQPPQLFQRRLRAEGLSQRPPQRPASGSGDGRGAGSACAPPRHRRARCRRPLRSAAPAPRCKGSARAERPLGAREPVRARTCRCAAQVPFPGAGAMREQPGTRGRDGAGPRSRCWLTGKRRRLAAALYRSAAPRPGQATLRLRPRPPPPPLPPPLPAARWATGATAPPSIGSSALSSAGLAWARRLLRPRTSPPCPRPSRPSVPRRSPRPPPGTTAPGAARPAATGPAATGPCPSRRSGEARPPPASPRPRREEASRLRPLRRAGTGRGTYEPCGGRMRGGAALAPLPASARAAAEPPRVQGGRGVRPRRRPHAAAAVSFRKPRRTMPLLRRSPPRRVPAGGARPAPPRRC